MLDAEELYYKLQRTIENEGLTLNVVLDDCGYKQIGWL